MVKIVKIKDSEDKVPSTTNLASTADLTAVENKISNISTLVNKADHDAKIPEIEKIYFPTSNYNKFTNNILDTR